MNFSVILAMIIMGGLGLIFGAWLAVASRVFMVKRDQRIALIEEALPGANCGACGAPGCSGFAEGVVKGVYPVNGCTVGGADVAAKVAEIMGTKAGETVLKVAVVRCRGDHENAVDRAQYTGIQDCRAAVQINNGPKGCEYGCLGLGTCAAVCPFDAIKMSENGLPVVDEALCTGCGECVKACPRNIMALLPRDQKIYLACVSRDFGKAVKAVCKVGCIGCTLCANPKTTANEIITMEGKLPVIHYDRVNDPVGDLQNAVEKCPTKSFAVRDTSGKQKKKQ
ncbi:RnfABCDGE type electron transport complex subunit B [bacterium]|nr:RnfABCDGE type electron transport complex subunit B [bacterium]